jgi:toxin YoeB
LKKSLNPKESQLKMFEHVTTKQFDKQYERYCKFAPETFAKIRILIADTLEHPMEGLGKPERLKHLGDNVWSRLVDKKNPLRYSIEGNIIYFECCTGQYKDHYGFPLCCLLNFAIRVLN